MSDHRQHDHHYRELISGYIDGDLTAAERHELLRHLASCQECRRTLETYRQIGGQLRSLPPATPPPHLREAIYAETINSGSRRLIHYASRVGYGMAALAAVALIFIVAVYLLVNGYQRTVDPEVINSEPVSNVIWPLHKPVEITFNKAMNQESVEAALSISPASEKERLSITWDGNTMIVGQNQSLKAGSSYSLLITEDAEDEFGNNLDGEFRLQFQASDTITQLETPVPLATPTPRPTLTPSPQPTATDEPTNDNLALPTQTRNTATPAPPPGGNTQPPTDPGAITEPPVDQPPSDPGNEPVQPSATPTEPDLRVPDPTATPTNTPEPTSTTEPTATPPSEPTATPTPTAEPPTPTEPLPPTETPTPDAIPVVGAFGNLYWKNDVVRDRLGDPQEAAISISAHELDFQHGEMFQRGDSGIIYVLESTTGVWSSMQDTGEVADPVAGPVAGTWEPSGALGALWSSEAWIQTALGFALAPDGTDFASRAQSFANGTMLMSSSGQIYVLYSDGTWELWPDPGP